MFVGVSDKYLVCPDPRFLSTIFVSIPVFVVFEKNETSRNDLHGEPHALEDKHCNSRIAAFFVSSAAMTAADDHKEISL